MTAALHDLRVGSVSHEPDDSTLVTLEVPASLCDAFRFLPGQHVSLRVELDGVELRRSYSIASAQRGPLRIGVRLTPGGRVSGWIASMLRPGHVVQVMTPTGHFTTTTDRARTRRVVAIAAGSGITPVYSIVASVLADEPHSFVTLLCVNRGAGSAMLLEDVEALRNRYLGRFTLWHYFTRESSELELLSGTLDRDRLAALCKARILATDADEYFLCGPEPLLELLHAALAAQGVDPSRLRDERFGTAGASTRVDDRAGVVAQITATIGGRISTFPVREGESILDAARRVRPDVPFSCTAGVCSTCRAILKAGTVTQRVTHGLERDELARGFVLTCQAHPTSAEVTVDFDA